jgi:iron complex outermembrane receptor protein
MNHRLSILLAGPSLFALATTAAAQTATTPTPPAETKSANEGTQAEQTNEATQASTDEGTIVITARRRAESLLDVPQTVSAVTNKDLKDFNATRFQDIASLVSGLTLGIDSNGFPAETTRGVLSQVTAQGTPTVENYINEVPFEPNLIFQGNFDIGQVEILKGPQGTLRGRSSPSGAITQTTRRPDLNEIGGDVNFLGTSHGGINMQAALGVPIIQDVLAVRVAGLLDASDSGGIKSVNNPDNPRERTQAGRITLRFEPTSSISAVVMYEHLLRTVHDYGTALFGNGAAGINQVPGFNCPTSNQPVVNHTCPATSAPLGFTSFGGTPAIYAPPGFNGPVIARGSRLAVQDFLNYTRQRDDLITGQLDWKFQGQKLSYVGGYQNEKILVLNDSDAFNTVVGRERKVTRATHAIEKRLSHELRLSSDERIGGFLDYTVGGFYQKVWGPSASEGANTLTMPGAFGSPLGANAPGGPGLLSPFTYDPKYVVGFDNQTQRKTLEKALFANVMVHIGSKTEFSAGGRKIWETLVKSVNPVSVDGFAAVRNPLGLGACPTTAFSAFTGLGVATGIASTSTYPGTCDMPVSLGNGAPAAAQIIQPIAKTTKKYAPFVYNFSLSHHFTRDIMAYATYGTAWRAGPGPITAAPTCAANTTHPDALNPLPPLVNAAFQLDPDQCTKFNFLDPDKAKSIEFGIKAALFNRRLNVAVAVYRETFSALFVRGDSAVPNLTGNCIAANLNITQLCNLANSTFTYGAPARVRGIDFDSSFRVSEDLNLGAVFSWAKSRFTGGLIPCHDMPIKNPLFGQPGQPQFLAGFDGIPDTNPTAGFTASDWIAAGGPFGPAKCSAAGIPATSDVPWNVTLRGEYSHEVFNGGRAFLRALYNYYPKNTNSTAYQSKAYGLLSLFAGLRASNGAWEFSIAGRNILNNKTVLTQGVVDGNLVSPGQNLNWSYAADSTPANGGSYITSQNAGYRALTLTQRREFQVSARFSFGSR